MFFKHVWAKRIPLLASIVVAFAGITLSFTLWGHKGNEDQYFTEPIERGPIRMVVNATGNVQAVVTVQVGSQVSGQVQALYADYNSIVKRGELLAKIDPRNFEAQVEDSKANLASAEAHLLSAQADLATQQANLLSAKANLDAARVQRDNDARIQKRYQEMLPSGIVAQNDYDTVKATADSSRAKYVQAAAAVDQAQAQINSQRAQMEQAKAQVLQAKADLNKSEINLEYCDIFSPVDGVVVSRSIDVGQTVAASLQAPLLFVIANDLTKMQVNASVDEADIGHISDKSDVKFTADAYPNQSFSGKIAEIRLNPQTVQNVVTYSVIINVDNFDLKLKPGMTANVTITVAQRDNVLKIPNAALRYLPPGMTRDKETSLALGAKTSGQSQGKTATPPGRELPAGKQSAERAGGNQLGAPGATQQLQGGEGVPALAPGQMWEVSQKIRFPAPSGSVQRPAVVWVLGANNKPEPQRVVLGITDGSVTEVVSGDLKENEQLIIADSSQESSGAAGVRSPFGLTPGRRGR